MALKITYKGDYALKAILELSLQYGSIVTIRDLAKKADIPIKFLEQVLLTLKRGGFVKSRRGRIGGYILAKPPAKIKVGDIIRYIEGPIEPIGCVNKGYSGCKDVNHCVLRKVFADVAKATSNIVDNVTFEKLADQVRSSKIDYSYVI